MVEPIRILSIEDSEDDLLLIIRLLHRSGMQVAYQRVETPGEMRRALEEDTWDAVLADYRLPQFSVHDALDLLRELGLDLPLIVVSGTIGEETAVACMRAGAHDYVMKHNPARLPSAIVREIREADVRRERRRSAEALFKSERQLRQQVVRQNALLQINDAVQRMAHPEDLEMVVRSCFDALKKTGLVFCALAIQRLLDETKGVFAFYEIQSSGRFFEQYGENRNLLGIWRRAQAYYRPDLDARPGGLTTEHRDQMEKRYGVSVRSIVNVPCSRGLLSVLSDRTDAFSPDEIQFLEQVGQVLAVGITRMDDMEFLDGALRHLPEGVCLLNAARLVVFANALGADILKAMKLGVGNEPIDAVDGQPLGALRDPGGLPHEMKLDDRVVEVLVAPIQKGFVDGGWALVFRDVTREREEREKIERHDRLASVGQLAAGIAHDFNNMLTVITGFAQMLGMREDFDALAREDLTEIYNQGQRAAQLVRQILDFSRSSGVERRPVDMAPFTKEAVKMLARTMPETMTVQCEVEIDSAPVHANLTQMQQVLTNLAINARDAMPEGGTLTVAVSKAVFSEGGPFPSPDLTPGAWVRIDVTDTGTGMPPEVRDRIFEPFFTTKDVGEGTGLGLSQVYGIVKQHEGVIDVQSEAGKGATFAIYLPLIDASPPTRDLHEDLPRGNGELVLVAEDEDDVRKSLTAILEHLNYRVVTACTGREALAVFEACQEEVEAVLADLVMPEGDGLFLLDALKARGAMPPFGLMSGYVGEADRLKARMGRAGGFLEKPLEMHAVAQLLHRMLLSDMNPEGR